MGATQLIQKISRNPATANIVQQMQQMCTALIDMANKTLKADRMTTDDDLYKLRDLDLVHCPTVDLPVCVSGKYPNILS